MHRRAWQGLEWFTRFASLFIVLEHSAVLRAEPPAKPRTQPAETVERVVRDLSTAYAVRVTDQAAIRDLIFRELALDDEAYPLTVDIVACGHKAPQKIAYFLPGGGTNFQSSFFSPREDNLSQFFCEQGYLVVGVTPREESIPADTQDLSFTQSWGMARHRRDIRSIVQRVQGTLALPYEMLGHSYGASSALDYASHYSAELERVIALDIYSIDPASDPTGIAQAQATYAAHVTLLEQGQFVDPANAQAGVFAQLTPEAHMADSGASREAYGVPGNFTNDGLIYISLIYNAQLPGIHSNLTGLAGDWPLKQSVFAGTYSFAPDPLDDVFAFNYLERSTLTAASAAARSGLIPLAFARDYWAVVAGHSAYSIDWTAIKTRLVWLNAELAYGAQTFGARAAAAAGNSHVQVGIIPGYGHGDMLLSRSARKDVWRLLRGK